MIRVLIAEDQAIIRTGLKALAERDGDIEVVAEAEDGRTAVALSREHHPDVVLMDIRMPGVDGVMATQLIAEDPTLTDVRVLVLTTFAEKATVLEAIRAGAAGYLLKDADADELRKAIHRVAAGEPILSPAVAATLMTAIAGGRQVGDPSLIAHLAPRERDVLAEVGQGFNNTEIAERLFISPSTARTYVSRLLAKLDARDRSQLVILAYESGLVDGQRED